MVLTVEKSKTEGVPDTSYPERSLDALTSMRFFAAFAIYICHARGVFENLLHTVDAPVLTQGVSFFFVLSGFFICTVYSNLKPGVETVQFMVKRIARIWPLHVLTLFAWIVVFNIHNGKGVAPEVFLANLSLVQSLIPCREFYHSLNNPSWSLSTELAFYSMFPLLLVSIRRSLTGTVVGAMTVTLAMIAISECFSMSWHSPDPTIEWFVYVSPLSRALEFILGMAISYSLLKVRKDLSVRVRTFLEVGSLLLVCCLVFQSRAIAESIVSCFGLGEASLQWLLRVGVSLPGFVALITAFGYGGGLLSKLLSHPIMVLMGSLSFALYIWHKPLLTLHMIAFPGHTSALDFTLLTAFLIVSSYLLYRLAEQPLRSVIVKLGTSRI